MDGRRTGRRPPPPGGTQPDGDDGTHHAPAPGFMRLRIVLEPGETRPHVEEPWRGVLVVVLAGRVELRCDDGGRRTFGTGSALWFYGLGLRAIHNPDDAPTVLLAIARRKAQP